MGDYLSEDLPVITRPPTNDDYGFILKTWSEEYHKVHPFNYIPNQIFIPNQKTIIDQILSRSQILIACLDDEPNNLVGYTIFQPFNEETTIFHWMHIKGIYRREYGLFQSLIKEMQIENKNVVCSHYFTKFKFLKDKYHLVYDPTILGDK